MDRKFITAWMRHHLDENNERPAMPKDTPVSAVRRECIDILCRKVDVTVNDTDPATSLHDVARKLNAEVPDCDIDKQTAKLYQLAFSDLSNSGGSSTGEGSATKAAGGGRLLSCAGCRPQHLDKAMQVTSHFKSEEWTQPARYGLPSVDYPVEWIHSRLIFLCDVLEELRQYLMCPIYISSGYRTLEWNDLHIAAGHSAARGSMHIHGVAADIQVKSFSPEYVHYSLISLHDSKRLRIGGIGLYSSFVHVDVRYILPGMTQGLVKWKG